MLEGDGTCAALQPLSTRDGADRLRLGLIGDLAAERELPEGLRGGGSMGTEDAFKNSDR